VALVLAAIAGLSAAWAAHVSFARIATTSIGGPKAGRIVPVSARQRAVADR